MFVSAVDLDEYFNLGEEIACYKDMDGPIQTIKYFLTKKNERAALAQCGHVRSRSITVRRDSGKSSRPLAFTIRR